MDRRFGYAGRRVLVLGASGFIGQWVTRRLAGQGAEVLAAVRETTVARSPGHAQGTVVMVDLEVPGAAAELIRSRQPDIVFNLAGYGVSPLERDPAKAARINHEVVNEVALACHRIAHSKWSGQHLVHAGSALEYGTVGGDLAETTQPLPTTLYGRTKLAGTLAVARASNQGVLRGATARLFTVYGPGERPGRLLPSLVQAGRDGKPLALTSGHQRRDFTYVEDVAEGLLRIGLLPQACLGPVNLATGELESVRGFVVRAAGVLGLRPSQLRLGDLPDRAEEMVHDPVNIGLLRVLCNWCPTTSIEEGVRRTRDWE